jgi:hypothetical protein
MLGRKYRRKKTAAPEIHTVTILRRKRDEISASNRMHELKITQARAVSERLSE